MKFIKKNQIIVAVIGLMLITAGYLNFNNEEINNNKLIETGSLVDAEEMAAIGDAQLVSTNPIENENKETNAVLVQNDEVDEYFTKSRLERDTMYSQMIESYQKILDKTDISEAQKKIAQNEIKKINEQKNAIMIAENLLKTKGFEDLIIFINDKSINIVIKAKKLEQEQIAQVQNLITRELKADIDDIHISNK